MEPRNISFEGVIDSCINISDSRCYISLEERCRGETCEFYEPKGRRALDNYRKTFADFPLVTGSLLDSDFDPAVLGLG